jgi:hypothetical protein
MHGWASPQVAPHPPEAEELRPLGQVDPLLEEESEDLEETLGSLAPRHGIWIALGTFVPTLLATFLGLPYLLGGPVVIPLVLETPPGSTALLPDAPASPSTRSQTRAIELPTVQAKLAVPAPILPAAQRATARQSVAPAASGQPKNKPIDWMPVAAFEDRGAAHRLAASIKTRGYPVEIRHDRSSTRSWIVWISVQPNRTEPHP